MGIGALEGLFSWRSPFTAFSPNLSRQQLLVSRLCTETQLTSPEFLQWVRLLQKRSMDENGHLKHLHRKLWEWCFICETLQSSGLLAPGKRGLGFAVGKEPLAACFAGRGCEIVATDLDPEQARETGWIDSLQHARHLEDLYRAHLCDQTVFQEQVSFRSVDMNDIPTDLTGFDFVWSSCAFEHLGSIEKGQAFIYRMMDCLKPGGVAVHTTEFNLSSNKETLAEGVTVLFRRQDINTIAKTLRRQGHYIQVDYRTGNQPADQIIDLPPYAVTPHLKLQVFQFVVTSIGLVIVKGNR